jgi:hypothetical protein
VIKKFGFKALGMVASLGMTAVLVGGCNPAEEPAKPASPPAVSKPGPKADEKKPAPTAAPAAPTKEADKTK